MEGAGKAVKSNYPHTLSLLIDLTLAALAVWLLIKLVLS
jgi:hypothetical protein